MEHRNPLMDDMEDSPSLYHHAQMEFEKAYRRARKLASVETGLKLSRFPEQCPWTLEQVLDSEFLPE